MSYFEMEWVEIYLPDIEVSVVLDVGSHNGTDGMRFKTKYPQARVIAIEADRSLYDKMLKSQKITELEILNYAVCDQDGMINFHHNDGVRKGSGSIHKPKPSLFRYVGMSFSDPYEIPSTRLDTLCKNMGIVKIDIIHMDIQGAEHEALIGLGEMRPKMIFLEIGFNGYEGAVSPVDKLIDMGYKKIDVPIKGDELWVYYN